MKLHNNKPHMYIIDEGLNLISLNGDLAEPIYDKLYELGYDELTVLGHDNVDDLAETLRGLQGE